MRVKRCCMCATCLSGAFQVGAKLALQSPQILSSLLKTIHDTCAHCQNFFIRCPRMPADWLLKVRRCVFGRSERVKEIHPYVKVAAVGVWNAVRVVDVVAQRCSTGSQAYSALLRLPRTREARSRRTCRIFAHKSAWPCPVLMEHLGFPRYPT
jgi:hypothetical protein